MEPILAEKLRTLLECCKAYTGGEETDALGVSKNLVASDGTWGIKMPSKLKLGGQMVIPFTKLHMITKALEDGVELTMEHKNVECVVKSGGSVWKLSLRAMEIAEEPDGFKPLCTTDARELTEAIKLTSHMMRKDLSRPGLMFGWLDGESLVVGDGSRLGKVLCSSSGEISIPLEVLKEVRRQLTIIPEEVVEWGETKDHLVAKVGDRVLWFRKMAGSFERELHDRIEKVLKKKEGEIVVSRTDLRSALQRVRPTAYELCTISQRKGLILETRNAVGERGITTMTCSGDLGADKIKVPLAHLEEAVELRKEESMSIEVGKGMIRLRDEAGWEVLSTSEDKW